MTLDEELIESLGNHNQPCAVRKIMMVGTHGVFHGMFGRGACQLHGDACHCAAISDAFSCFHIISVSDCTWQVFRDILDGGQGDGFAQDVHAVAYHYLCVVEQSIKSLVCRVFGGNGSHQFRVYDGKNGSQFRCAETDFLIRVGIGDNAPAIDFGACS